MILLGDAATVLHDEVPDGCVRCIVTSPPYYKLRTYGDDAQEIGREESLVDYLASLRAMTNELHRVLTDDGTFWLNIGETYDPNEGMLLVPFQVARMLKDTGWFLRSGCIWNKTRWMPNGGKNRPILVHEDVFMFTKQNSGYYYNPDTIREPHSPVSLKRWASAPVAALGGAESMGVKRATSEKTYRTKRIVPNPLGKLKTSVWNICPSNFKGKHFAVMPKQLAETCILASSEPGDIVLDPFCGAGTTGVVCKRHHRDFIGVELYPDIAALAATRIEAS